MIVRKVARLEERLRELRVWNFCCGRTTGTRGVLRGPRGPKNMAMHISVTDRILKYMQGCQDKVFPGSMSEAGGR